MKEGSLNEGYSKTYMLLVIFYMSSFHVMFNYTSLCECVHTSESLKKSVHECTGTATCVCEYSQPPGISTPLRIWRTSYWNTKLSE